MKKYIKPQIELNKFEIEDIMSTSGVGGGLFSGLADIDNSSSVDWGEEILDP